MRHVYVHVPFCRRRCVYCDFAIAVRGEIPGSRYVNLVRQELEWRKRLGMWDDVRLETLYFGGGTPSLLPANLVGALVDSLGHSKVPEQAAGSAEITLEVNPDDVSVESGAAWREAGINRVSIGVQSFQDAILQWMHRTHSAAAARQALNWLGAEMDSVSLDLIFGLPRDLEHDFSADLEQAIAAQPDHISVYGLTVESATTLGKWVARGAQKMPLDEGHNEEFLLAHELLTAAGYEHYEISSYARPGHRSRHNACYWTGASYCGLGPSAHSFSQGNSRRSWNLRNWSKYARSMDAGCAPEETSEELGGSQRDLERVYLGLRTIEGIPPQWVNNPGFVAKMAKNGWLEVNRERIALSPSGWLRMDQIILGLTTYAEGG